MFVKMYPSPHEELEDIESSDDETEICEIKTPERSPSKKQKSPRKERKPWKTFMHSNAQWVGYISRVIQISYIFKLAACFRGKRSSKILNYFTEIPYFFI